MEHQNNAGDTPADAEYAFVAPVRVDPEARRGYMKHYVLVPAEVGSALGAEEATHVEGTLAGRPFRRQLQRRPGGALTLRFGEDWLRAAQTDVGDEVAVTLRPDSDPDRVEVPAALADALARDAQAARAWAALPPGRRKMLCYGVENAKRPETRTRRAEAVVREVAALLAPLAVVAAPEGR